MRSKKTLRKQLAPFERPWGCLCPWSQSLSASKLWADLLGLVFLIFPSHSFSLRSEQQKIMWMYWQSVFVWNLPFHFYSYSILLYVALFYSLDALSKLSVFQLLGIALILAAILPKILQKINERVSRDKATPLVAKEKSEMISPESQILKVQNSQIFWPRDCESLSADRYPLGVALFTKPVKLYDFSQLLRIRKETKVSFRRALSALRILRYSNPTQFTFVICMLCGWGIILSSFFSAKSLILIASQIAMFSPGLFRRNVLFKLRRRLEANKFLKKLLDEIIVDENPNLEETNTQKIMAFVANSNNGNVLPKVVTIVKKAA